MDYKNILFLRKIVYLWQKGPKLNTWLDTRQTTQWNQILKKYANDLDEQTELFTVSELHAKISTLEEKGLSVYCLQFFEPERSKVVDSQIWQVPYYQSNGTNIRNNYYCCRNFIKNEIRCIRYKTNVYPSKADIEFLRNCYWQF